MKFEHWWASKYPAAIDETGFALMREAWGAAIAAEREACATLCDQRERDPADDEAPLVWLRAVEAIRMRSNEISATSSDFD